MNLLSNSVYSSAFTYNPYVLTRPYRHLTFVALIEPHKITCVSHDISVLIVGFETKNARAEWIPYKPSETNLPPLNLAI